MIKSVLFDFDGVLINSSSITIKYFKEAIKHFGFREPSDKEIIDQFGLKTTEMFSKLLPKLDESEIEHIRNYGAKLSLKYAPDIPFISGSLEAVKLLSKKYKLAIVTSRAKASVDLLRKKHNLDNYFQVIIDREDVQNHKPHPEPLFKALKALGTKNTEAIYIGDTESDVGAARNAKMPCVLISKSKKNLGADYYISSIKELPKLIRKIQSKRKVTQVDK